MVKVGDKLICIKERKLFHDVIPIGFISEVLKYDINGSINISTPNSNVCLFYNTKENGYFSKHHEDFVEHFSFNLYKALERDKIINEILYG